MSNDAAKTPEQLVELAYRELEALPGWVEFQARALEAVMQGRPATCMVAEVAELLGLSQEEVLEAPPPTADSPSQTPSQPSDPDEPTNT